MPFKTTILDTAVVKAGKATAKNASETNRQQGQNIGNINRNNNRTIVDTEDNNYRVDTPKVGRMIALHTENFNKKLNFDTFREKLATYINKELKRATDVVCVLKHMKDPKYIDNKNKPKEPTEEGKNPSMKNMVQDKEVK